MTDKINAVREGSMSIQQIAAEVAPQLDAAIRDWLASDMIFGSDVFGHLQNVLWDNKVGILRVLEAAAKQGEQNVRTIKWDNYRQRKARVTTGGS